MGRDGVLPRRFFAAVSKRFRSPVFSLVTVGVVGFVALFLDVATSTSFINFGAFIAFAMVNVSVIVYYVKRKSEGTSLNPVMYLVVPAIGGIVTLYLMTQLDSNAITLGLVWLAIGVVILGVITRGFKKLPPEIEFAEVED